jgi:hypothetical protein
MDSEPTPDSPTSSTTPQTVNLSPNDIADFNRFLNKAWRAFELQQSDFDPLPGESEEMHWERYVNHWINQYYRN